MLRHPHTHSLRPPLWPDQEVVSIPRPEPRASERADAGPPACASHGQDGPLEDEDLSWKRTMIFPCLRPTAPSSFHSGYIPSSLLGSFWSSQGQGPSKKQKVLPTPSGVITSAL